MKNQLENAVDMAKVSISVCDKHAELIASIPALNDVYLRVKAKMAEIDKTIQEQIAIITGKTEAKNQSKTGLVKIADTVVQSIMAFAHKATNVNLEKEIHYCFSTMARMRDEELLNTCYIIHAKGVEHITDISGFGVDAATMDNLLAAIHEYELICHVPREAIKTRKTCTHNLETLIHELSDMMKNELDRLIHILPDEYASFKETYKSSRAMINHRGKIKKAAAETTTAQA